MINPLIATLCKENKTTWLNILHAGWPGGLVVTGVVVIFMSGSVPWEYQISLILIPTLIYGFMMLTSHFPVSERVAAGVSYKEMLAEMGWGKPSLGPRRSAWWPNDSPEEARLR